MSANHMSDPDKELPLGPFLGRRTVLARLCQAIEDVRLGHGAKFWIVGSSGIGKTRLLDEIERYAAWRGVPVDRSDPDRGIDASRPGPRLEIIDPVAPEGIARLEGRFPRSADQAILRLATAGSVDRCRSVGIPGDALVVLGELDSGDAIRLLHAWLGQALDPTWARRIIRSTGGHPGRLRQAAKRFLETRREALAKGRLEPPARPGS